MPGVAEAADAAYACFVSVSPGQVPVTRSNPVAPARSISAFTQPKTAPWIAAAAITSRQVRSWSFAAGASLSRASSRQSLLEETPGEDSPEHADE